MIYRTKIRLKRLANGSDTAKVRQGVVDLIEVHGGKNGTPNPRDHVVGIFVGSLGEGSASKQVGH